MAKKLSKKKLRELALEEKWKKQGKEFPVCDGCGKAVIPKEIYDGNEPFESEVFDENRRVKYCPRCLKISLDDI